MGFVSKTMENKIVYLLLIFYFPEEVGMTREECEQEYHFPYVVRQRVYSKENALGAYNAYAETPCYWSELCSNIHMDEVEQYTSLCKKRLLKGICDDLI